MFTYLVQKISDLKEPKWTKRWFVKGFKFHLHPDRYSKLPSVDGYTEEERNKIVSESYLRLDNLADEYLYDGETSEWWNEIDDHFEYLTNEHQMDLEEWTKKCDSMRMEYFFIWVKDCQRLITEWKDRVRIEEPKHKKWLQYRSFRDWDQFQVEFMKRFNEKSLSKEGDWSSVKWDDFQDEFISSLSE